MDVPVYNFGPLLVGAVAAPKTYSEEKSIAELTSINHHRILPLKQYMFVIYSKLSSILFIALVQTT